ncbi:MAG TPA: IS701 family transposase, partial [Saprospiraceae bacterium]|nr:IS701 family transposase [Saprospiraceae bacterium]
MKNRHILDLYSDYLIASFNLTTATGLSELLGGALSHDQISRFLGQRQFHQMDYWKCIKSIVRKIEHPQGVIKIDDTIEEKPHSTENDIITWHWDHSKKPKAGLVKGINILNFQYQSPLDEQQNISIPVAFEIVKKTESWFDSKSGKVKTRSPVTKNTMVRERLRILHHMNKLQFKYVLWDTWFSSKDNLEFVHYELQKFFVVAVKSNRKVALNCPEENLNRKYIRVDELDFQKASTITVWLKGLDFPTTLCKQVFTNKDGSTGELYLITND